jgi:cellulose biosynthesis protein BcsQ
VTPFVVWLVVCLKGGVGKTKTAVYLAQELADREFDVLLYDADPGTQGVADWITGWLKNYPDHPLPFDVGQWVPGRGGLLGQVLVSEARRTQASYVVVDMGAESPDEAKRLAVMADQVIVPMGTHMDEVARLDATMTQVRSPDTLVSVLLTRVDEPGKGKALDYRASMVKDGHHVLDTEIRRSGERYGRFGCPILDTYAYAGVVDELLKREEHG